MVSLKKYQNKNVAIYGLGKSGLASAKKLKSLKANIFCWDDNQKARARAKKLKFNISKFWEKKIDFVNYVIISPGIDIKTCKIKKYLKKSANKIITDLDVFFEIQKKPFVISVTGTNGKSTTCKIIEKILKKNGHRVSVAGNIGKPVLSLNKANNKIFILEISSYQLQYSKLFQSRHAVILNISPDHLERHKNMENYIKVKSKIFLGQRKGDFSYINPQGKYFNKITKVIRSKKIESNLTKVKRSKYNFLFKKLKNKYLIGEGNKENLIFAIEVSKNLKVNDNTILKALKNFKGLPHRQEVVFSKKNILCVNDSKATSFDAAFKSLLNYNKIYWILGGLPKYKDQFRLSKVSKKIVRAYIIGKNISFFKKQLKRKIPYTVSNNLKDALISISKDIKQEEKSNKTILFSPAAASFDQYNNFEQRGNYFKNLVNKQLKTLNYV